MVVAREQVASTGQRPDQFPPVVPSDEERAVEVFRIAPELEGYRKIGPI